MTTFSDTFSVTTALVGSLAAPAPVAALAHPGAEAAHRGAMTALRVAQVELYCDHDAAAMTALREARRSLAGEGPAEAVALASLDEAAWHIRRHEMPDAQRAIAHARLSLA